MNGQNRINNGEFRTGAPQKGRIVVTYDEGTGKYNYEKVRPTEAPVYQEPIIPELAFPIEEQQIFGNVDASDAWQEAEYPTEVVIPERKSKKRLRHQRIGQAIILSAALSGSYAAVDTVTTLGHSGKAPNIIEDVSQLPAEIGKSGETVVDIVDSVGQMINGMTSFNNIGDK